MRRGPLTYPVPFWLLAPLALCAGMAALLHLLSLAAELGFEFGLSVALQTEVFGSFVGAAALGAFLVGARTDASTRPLRWFGLLQLGLAIYTFASPLVLSLFGDNGSLLAIAFAVTAMPGLLTGGSVAVLVRAGSHTTERAATAVGVLLGSVTIGGALALPVVAKIGPNVEFYGAALHCVVGLAAWGLSIPLGAREIFGGTASRAVASDLRASWTGDGGSSALAALVAIGIALPLHRFAWRRVLPAGGEPLFLHLFGLGLGCGFGALLVPVGSNARRVLARALLAAALFLLVPLLFAASVLRSGAGSALAAILLVPGGFGAGLVLPLIFRAALSDREAIGRQAGALFGIFAGAWAATLLLFVPHVIGASGPAFMVFCAGTLVLAGGTWVAFGRGLREWIPAGAAALVAVVILLAGGLRPVPSRASIAVDADSAGMHRTIAERITPDSSYAVVEALDTGVRRLYRDGVPDAPAQRYSDGYRMVAQLPLLLHGRPERVLVGSFGTGVVAAAVLSHSGVKVVEAVDDSDAVFELAGEFALANDGVRENSRLTTLSQPLRRVLRSRNGAYDALVFEPRAASGIRGALYFTSEFYVLALSVLRDDGYLCQRLPTETWGLSAMQRAVAAAAESFRSVSLWEFECGLFMLAGNAPPSLKADAFLVRVSEAAPDLQAARVSDPSHLLAGYVCDAADFAGSARPLRDGELGDAGPPGSEEWRAHVARCSTRSGPVWAKDLYDTLPGAAARWAELREILASGHSTSAALYALAEPAREDLRTRAAAERQHYAELMARNDWSGAARLSWVRDRTTALRQLAASMEDADRRRFYEILLLRSGGLLDEAALARLAGELTGAEQIFVRNRLHALRGERAEDGEASMPAVTLRDPAAALSSGSEEAIREQLLDAECAGLLAEFDKATWEWWKAQGDKADAVLLLDAAGWRHAVRAARQVIGQSRPSDLVALAPIFAAAYPEDSTWDRLCSDEYPGVRVAGAEAARAHGTRAHVETLVRLCQDSDKAVRTGAYHSLQGILGEAVTESGYDPDNPSPDSLKRLAAHVTEERLPAAPGK